MVSEASFAQPLKRGDKFDWLYETWRTQHGPEALQRVVEWRRPVFWDAVSTNEQHDERAALVCAMTAICVLRGCYVAVGDEQGGYFFLPPWQLWQAWARDCLDTNRKDSRLSQMVTVWIDGVAHARDQPLPPTSR